MLSNYIPIPPKLRRILAALTLGGGVWFIGQFLVPTVPRESEVRMDLRAFRGDSSRARRLSVVFAQRGQAVRVLQARFEPTGPPSEWRSEISIPPGAYRATVTVEMDRSVAEHQIPVELRAGESVYLNAPSPP
jgi:hypothetical protein